MRNARSIAFGILLAACGGSSSGPATPAESATAAPAPTGPSESDQELAAAQASAARAMCERLVDCSVEDARATMSDEEVAKLDLEATVPKAKAECESEATASPLSPRQIKIIQACVNQPGDCAALNACLDGARKQ